MLVGEKSLFMLAKSPSNSATQKGDFLSTFGQVAWGYPEPGSFLAQGRVRGRSVYYCSWKTPSSSEDLNYVFPTRVVCLWYDVVRDFFLKPSQRTKSEVHIYTVTKFDWKMGCFWCDFPAGNSEPAGWFQPYQQKWKKNLGSCQAINFDP